MCGIGGIFAYHVSAPAPDRDELARLSARLAARGPDGAGLWTEGAIGLIHRRLAIIDLSERAKQPMISACGGFVIVFNGEIYNHAALAVGLRRDGIALKTSSDTEVLLELLVRKGVRALDEVRGMYAFALYNRESKQMLLARDPYGIKPLYYSDDGWTLRFASSVKALEACAIDLSIDPAAAVGFALFGSVPEPFTWRRSVQAVPAGCALRVDGIGAHAAVPHFSFAAQLQAQAPRPQDILGFSRAAFADSVKHHLVADVPVGVFLSAGVDSGALAGLMREQTQARICAVTLSFDEFRDSSEDEQPLAAAVAQHYGLEHHVERVSARHFSEDLDSALGAMDQPSIDGFNTWWVSKAARAAGLKVAISGLGGDELLGGYPSFRDLPRWRRALWLPAHVPLLGRTARALSKPLWQARNPKLPGMLEYGGSWAGLYLLKRGLFMPWELDQLLPPDLVREGLERLDLFTRLNALDAPVGAVSKVALLEAGWYMRHQLLRDADWASMAHGLEVRVPLVDTHLFAALAPLLEQTPLGTGKQLLAQAPMRALPSAITDRPKTGFGTPVGRWIDQHERFAAVRTRFSEVLKRQHWSRRLCVALLNDAGLPTLGGQ